MSESAIDRLFQRVQGMFALGRITASRDDRPTQAVQVALGEGDVRDAVPALGQYGFTSRPLAGAEALVLFLGGARTNPIIIATGDRLYRLRELAPGEVALYSDEGDSIALRRDGTIEVVAATKVRMETPLLEVTGDVTAGGISLKTHIHAGVEPGGGTSGEPV